MFCCVGYQHARLGAIDRAGRLVCISAGQLPVSVCDSTGISTSTAIAGCCRIAHATLLRSRGGSQGPVPAAGRRAGGGLRLHAHGLQRARAVAARPHRAALGRAGEPRVRAPAGLCRAADAIHDDLPAIRRPAAHLSWLPSPTLPCCSLSPPAVPRRLSSCRSRLQRPSATSRCDPVSLILPWAAASRLVSSPLW